MAHLFIEEIMSTRSRTAMDYPEASEALDVMAARLLQLLSDKNEKTKAYTERQLTRLDEELDELHKEINRG